MAGVKKQLRRPAESRVAFEPRRVERNHGNVRKPRLFESAPYKADVVACPAAAARLRHHYREPVGIVSARKYRFHYLPDNGDRRETGVVVDEFKPRVDSASVVVVKHDRVVAVLSEYGRENVKVYRAHLRRDDRVFVRFIHLFGVFLLFHAVERRFCLYVLSFAHFDRLKKRAYPYPDGA